MIPVGANGESAPATQPWATMIVIRNGGDPRPLGDRHRHRARPARPPRCCPPRSTRCTSARPKNSDRDQARVAPAAPHRRPGHPVERAVALRLREQQRHPHQRQEQVRRETRPAPRLERDRLPAGRRQVDRRSPRRSTIATHPGLTDGRAAQHDRHHQRRQRDPGQVHGRSSSSPGIDPRSIRRFIRPGESIPRARGGGPCPWRSAAGRRRRRSSAGRW